MRALARVRRVTLLLGAVGLLVLGACGDDGDGAGGDGAGDAEATEPSPDADGDAAASGGCGPTDVAITTPEGAIEVTSTTAVSLEDGGAYTVYLADFDLDPDAISLFASPEVPADGAMATVAITVFNAEEPVEPIEVGTEVAYEGSNFGVLTFVVTANHGEELYGTAIDAEGTLTVTAVGECIGAEIDYADEEKSISGTFNAPVRPL